MEAGTGGGGGVGVNGEVSAVWKPVCVCLCVWWGGIQVSSQLAANLLYDFEQVISLFYNEGFRMPETPPVAALEEGEQSPVPPPPPPSAFPQLASLIPFY